MSKTTSKQNIGLSSKRGTIKLFEFVDKQFFKTDAVLVLCLFVLCSYIKRIDYKSFRSEVTQAGIHAAESSSKELLFYKKKNCPEMNNSLHGRTTPTGRKTQ